MHRLSRKNYLPHQSAALARYYGKIASKRIVRADPDIVFAPVGSPILGFLETKVPIVYSTDATFQLIEGYYPGYSNLAKSSRHAAEELERRAIGRSDLILYPTDWAARSAVSSYDADSAKVHVVPYGANFTSLPDRATALNPRDPNICRILCVGSDWRRKGVSTVVEALRELRRMGIETELTICGCTPPKPLSEPGLTLIPVLHKDDPAQLDQMMQLYRTANFFCLPSQSECFGIVYCEASAFGLPSITSSTGGLPNVVRDGENGILLPQNAEGADYAAVIAALFKDKDRLAALRTSSRDRFEHQLNWDARGRSFVSITKEYFNKSLGVQPR